MNDTKMSQSDMDDDNYFYENSEEESISINANQHIDNERIDEFQQNYKIYTLKPYDNSFINNLKIYNLMYFHLMVQIR
jgi:hypothetical protein